LLFFPFVTALVDMEMLRHQDGGERLSPEMLLILALVTCDDYFLFPSSKERSAIGAGLRDRGPNGTQDNRERSGHR
jgi:hypothetical protein